MTVKSLRRALLGGTAVAALTLALAAPPARAFLYAASPGWHLAADGAYQWNEGQAVPHYGFADNIFPPYSTARAPIKSGWGAGLTVAYRHPGPWDFSFGFAANWLKGRDDASLTLVTAQGTSPAIDRLRVRLDYQVVDFEAGYNFTMGAGRARLFGGLRFLHLRQSGKGLVDLGPAFSYVVETERRTQYWGAGPRLGANAAFDLGPGGLHLFGGLSGALLLGRFKDDHSFNVITGPGGYGVYRYNDRRKTKLVPNFGGELGLGYSFATGGSAVSFAIGYRAEAWWGARSDGFVFPQVLGGQTSSAADLIVHGPFVRLTLGLGGGQ